MQVVTKAQMRLHGRGSVVVVTRVGQDMSIEQGENAGYLAGWVIWCFVEVNASWVLVSPLPMQCSDSKSKGVMDVVIIGMGDKDVNEMCTMS
jgi:hypothetical protein